MDQKRIDETFKLLELNPNKHALVPLYNAVSDLGITRLYNKNLDSLVAIIKNYLWVCPFDTSPTYFINLDGFKLLYQFTTEYEKQIEENAAILEKQLIKLIEDFTNKKGEKL